MAKSDLRSQLGSLLRSTWQQLDNVREVVVRQSKAGRIQIDLTLLRRKRRDALARLGAVVARLAANGKLNEDDFPELGGPLSELEALDERIADEEHRARATAAGLAVDPREEDRAAHHVEEEDEEAGEDEGNEENGEEVAEAEDTSSSSEDPRPR
jgi:hypothetical protein